MSLIVAKLSDKARLIAVVILMMLSVAVDSVYYIVSALTDALFMAAVVFFAWPIVKRVWQ